MIYSYLEQQTATQFFNTDNAHIAVPLTSVSQARILWLNLAVIHEDPNFKRLGGDVEAYKRHLISRCARVIPAGSPTDFDNQFSGMADRYGGSGIGVNGGSGRAVVVGEYLVKGCGRTPLVGVSVDPAHGSGGAYLEESIRETIFSEIVRQEFPFSSVPTLAIIDIGLKQVWSEREGTKHEWRTLLVRPNFLRPAHFERATRYHSQDPLDGAVDTMRVERMFQSAERLMGRQNFSSSFSQLWENWAVQLAYSFAHRLPHGSNTTSNVALDGALLDFGAMSSVPSWANIATMRRYHPFGTHAAVLRASIKSIGYHFHRYLCPEENFLKLCEHLFVAATEQYELALTFEALRIFGLTRRQASQMISVSRAVTSRAVSKIISFYQKEKADFCDQESSLMLQFNIASVWSEVPPQHLKELKSLIYQYCPDLISWQARLRCLQLSEPRTLYREEMRKCIHVRTDSSREGRPANVEQVSELINRTVVVNRRDHWLEIDDAMAVGFASSDSSIYALFKDCSTNQLFALKEKKSRKKEPNNDRINRIKVCKNGASLIDLIFEDKTSITCHNFRLIEH